MNNKFMPTEYIRGNTTNYIATILSFVAITLISCNKSQYYSNNKNISQRIPASAPPLGRAYTPHNTAAVVTDQSLTSNAISEMYIGAVPEPS
jgi:hypothetical protein